MCGRLALSEEPKEEFCHKICEMKSENRINTEATRVVEVPLVINQALNAPFLFSPAQC